MFKKIVKTYFDAETKTWKGSKAELECGSDVSLGHKIVKRLTNQPDHVSQICDSSGKQYTNEQILTMSIRVAQHLENIGIQQEDVIGICASNTDYIAPLVFGSLFCGAIISPLDPSFDKDGVRHVLSITKPKMIFCDGKIYQTVKESLTDIDSSIPIYTMKDHLEGVSKIEELVVSTGKEASFDVKPLKRGSSQTAAILCSSGTTGLPKGVCISHESLVNSFIVSLLSEDDKLLCFSTIYWLSGILCLLHGTITGCTRVITDQQYSPELFLRIIEQYNLNVAFTPPSQMATAIRCPDFAKRNLSSLHTYICGGSAVPFAVVQEITQHVRNCQVIVGYGMTEICGACCFGTATKAGENGQLKPNMEVKIIDDTGNKLGIGEVGEFLLKSPFQWSGYYGNPGATSEIYDQDGYIHSGDLGYFDEKGSLLIVDRKKDMLKYNNFHIFPTEIEEVIIQIPDVVEVCVCGIPDYIFSFLPAAAVIKVPNSSLTEDDVSKYVAERMMHFKHLHGGVYFVDSLPKTASGKNIRAKVTKIIESLSNGRKGKSCCV